MIWHFGTIDVLYIKQFGTIFLRKGKEEGLQLKAINHFKTFYNVFCYAIDFLPKIQLEIVMDDSQVTEALDVIKATAKTTKIGDGKIFVLPVEQAIRIRTDESGIDAL